MKKYDLIITPLAMGDIESITDYLNTFSPNISLNYYENIDQAIFSLSTMPERCALVRNESLREKGYRWISARNYTIYFVVDNQNNVVRIERVLYSKREYDVIL